MSGNVLEQRCSTVHLLPLAMQYSAKSLFVVRCKDSSNYHWFQFGTGSDLCLNARRLHFKNNNVKLLRLNL